MSVAEMHYVLIVHGTWNAPEAGETKWYQKGGAFAQALAQRLESTALAGAVWRNCAGKPTDFSWCGDNTHECRLEAADRLYEEILGIQDVDETARIHIVAHSHGGNVVLKSIVREYGATRILGGTRTRLLDSSEGCSSFLVRRSCTSAGTVTSGVRCYEQGSLEYLRAFR